MSDFLLTKHALNRKYSTAFVGRNLYLYIKPCAETKGCDDAYPFLGDAVPVHVDQEYRDFYTCTVLPHLSKNAMRFGESSPYRVTVPKFGLFSGIFQFWSREDGGCVSF